MSIELMICVVSFEQYHGLDGMSGGKSDQSYRPLHY
jgi:hypothetical protein